MPTLCGTVAMHSDEDWLKSALDCAKTAHSVWRLAQNGEFSKTIDWDFDLHLGANAYCEMFDENARRPMLDFYFVLRLKLNSSWGVFVGVSALLLGLKECGMGKTIRQCFMGVMAVALGSCAFNVEPFLTKEITGSDFLSFLAREYQRRTDFEVKVEQEWVHASRLAEKGERALAGEMVQPWIPSEWNVDPQDLPALETAYNDLTSRLKRGRQTTPEACARAQVYFDGWLEQANDNDYGRSGVGAVQKDNVEAERDSYEDIVELCDEALG